MSGKKILITGGCGFVGANLVDHLNNSEDEFDITVFDNLSRGNPEYLSDSSIKVVEGDIRDVVALQRALKGHQMVIHLAAYGSVVESVEDPVTNFEMNVLGTFNVVKEAAMAGIERLVFSSTGGALIGNAVPPVSEQSLPKPISPYGASKLCGEAYLHAFASSFGIQTIALRFANVFGIYSGHKKGAITNFMKNIHQGNPITIFGDGLATRDFLHAEDLAEGIAAALRLEMHVPAEVFHLSSGKEITIADLASEVVKASGHANEDVEILFEDKRAGEVERNFADFSKAREKLGFNPKIPLDKGLEEMWHWYNENVF